MPKNSTNPAFIRYLLDALRQGSASPEPSYDSMGRPVGATPPIVPSSVAPQQGDPMFGGMTGEAENALRMRELQRQQMLQQMGQ